MHLLGKEWFCRVLVCPKYVLKEVGSVVYPTNALDSRLRGDWVPPSSGLTFAKSVT